MLVYSVSSLPSFEMVQVIRDKILNHLVRYSLAWQQQQRSAVQCSAASDSMKGWLTGGMAQGTDWVPIVIVGNKSDLRPEQRQVSQDDGKKLAEKFGCGWTEASARYNENIGKAFELLVAQIEKSQNPNEAPDGGKCEVM